MDSDNNSHHTPGLKMAAVKIQHKNCLQSTLRKKIISTLFAGLGWSVLEKTVPSVSKPLPQFFPIRTTRPANNIYVFSKWLARIFCQITTVNTFNETHTSHQIQNESPSRWKKATTLSHQAT